MNNIALGRYLPLNSIVHKLDPRFKIMAMLFLLTAVFIPAGFYGYTFLALLIGSTVLLSKLSFKFILKAMKPMMLLIFQF